MPILESPAEAIFFAALEKSPAEERVRYLVEACGDDAELRSRVEQLLSAHGKVGVLDAPVATREQDLPANPPTFLTPPGTVIGRYKLLEPVGEGGYGTVFMAEQTSPVRRKVALKIIKAGMDTRQVIARFEAEQIRPSGSMSGGVETEQGVATKAPADERAGERICCT
jgi:hypothetical protein